MTLENTRKIKVFVCAECGSLLVERYTADKGLGWHVSCSRDSGHKGLRYDDPLKAGHDEMKRLAHLPPNPNAEKEMENLFC